MSNERIMIVEDEWAIANDIQKCLKNLGYIVSSVTASGEKAIQVAEEEKPDLILMDIVLQGEMDGIEAARQIHTHLNIPIVYLTAYDSKGVLERAKITEPFGYIIKPFEERELFITIEMAFYKHKAEEKMKKLANTDILTQTFNRVKFKDIIKREMEMVKRHNQPLSLLMFDVDNFKKINDSYGHNVGDNVLKIIANITKENIREIDYLVRWGGEEFLIVAPDTTLEKAEALAERLRNAIEIYNFVEVGRVTASFGVAYSTKNDTENALVKRVDHAMYQAKTAGKNNVVVNV